MTELQGKTPLSALPARPKRRHWTFDRWIVSDFLCAYVTLQYFALITIFRRGCGDLTNLDLLS